MNQVVPSAFEVRTKLGSLRPGELEALAASSRVPITTLIKLRNGQTGNPRIETVRQIWPGLVAATASPTDSTPQSAQQEG